MTGCAGVQPLVFKARERQRRRECDEVCWGAISRVLPWHGAGEVSLFLGAGAAHLAAIAARTEKSIPERRPAASTSCKAPPGRCSRTNTCWAAGDRAQTRA